MKILQVFSRYEQFGGEEASVRQIGAAIRTKYEVLPFYSSTKEMLGEGFIGKIQAPLKAIWNGKVFRSLRQLQATEQFDVWLIHNVFPGLSPAVYDAARVCRVPVIQYLHNYRFTCVNGLLLNHGEPCLRCLNGNFWPAVQTHCWRESRVACAAMGVSLVRLRAVGVFGQIAHWIAISHAQKRIHTRIGIPEEKISVLHHFYDGPQTQGQAHGDDMLFVGRLSPEKGVRLLVDTWLEEKIEDRCLWIVGEGPIRGRAGAASPELCQYQIHRLLKRTGARSGLAQGSLNCCAFRLGGTVRQSHHRVVGARCTGLGGPERSTSGVGRIDRGRLALRFQFARESRLKC